MLFPQNFNNIKPPPGTPINKYSPSSQGVVLDILLNEGGGLQVYDSSLEGNTGTINGATWENSLFGKVLNFNGSSNQVEIVHNPALSPGPGGVHTVLIWFYVNVIGNDGLITKRTTTNPEWDYFLLGGGVGSRTMGSFQSGGTPVVVLSNTDVSAGVWHLAGFEYNVSQVGFYLDGLPDGGGAQTRISLGGNKPVVFGSNNSAAFFDGKVSRATIYNRILSPKEHKRKFLNQHDSYSRSFDLAAWGGLAVDDAIMNQFQGPNMGADLFNGALI